MSLLRLITFRQQQESAPVIELDWTQIGPTYWSDYQASINQTIATRTVTDAVSTASGSYPGSDGLIGGVLLPDHPRGG